MSSTVAIELKNITKTFGSIVANKDVNLTVNRGEILSILGENGSGKTTLMNMISGIYFPDEGQIFINGARNGSAALREEEGGADCTIGVFILGIQSVLGIYGDIQADMCIVDGIALHAEDDGLLYPHEHALLVNEGVVLLVEGADIFKGNGIGEKFNMGIGNTAG